jgi:hypothetical protein
MLVRIEGRITDVRRLGDRWRAEVATAGGTAVVAGLAGAAVPAAAMPEGATVRVVGVVRRAHPAATDRRWAVVPRDPADVAVIAAAPASPKVGSGTGGDVSPLGASPIDAAAGGGDAEAGAVAVDLVDLDRHRGRQVRVGGLVTATDAAGFSLDDGTAIGRIEVVGDARELLPLLAPGDAVGVVGRVRPTDAGLVIRLEQAADLVRLGDLGEPVPLTGESDDRAIASDADPAALEPAALAGEGGDRPAGPGSGGGALPTAPAVAGGAGLGGFVLAAGGLVALRRRRVRRLAAERLAGRLATLTEGAGPSSSPRPAGTSATVVTGVGAPGGPERSHA